MERLNFIPPFHIQQKEAQYSPCFQRYQYLSQSWFGQPCRKLWVGMRIDFEIKEKIHNTTYFQYYFPDCHEISSEILRKWKCLSGSLPERLVIQIFQGTAGSSLGERKYCNRRLKSLRTTTYNGGIGDFSIYTLTQRTKTNYYWSITYYTVTAVLSLNWNSTVMHISG